MLTINHMGKKKNKKTKKSLGRPAERNSVPLAHQITSALGTTGNISKPKFSDGSQGTTMQADP